MLSGSNDNGAQVIQFESPPDHTHFTQAATGETEAHDAFPRLRFNSLTLDELSEELDRRTKETQRLQDELENVTKLTLEKFGCTYGIHSPPGQSCHNNRFGVYDSPGDSTVLSAHQQAVTQPLVCNLDSSNQVVAQKMIDSSREEVFEKAIDDCLQHLSDLQLNKTNDQPEQEIFSFDKAIVNLQSELHKVQMEKEVLSDLRLKDSRKHADQMEKMLCMLEELQEIKRAGDQKLQETEDEALALNRRVETLEKNIKEMYSSLLSREKQCGGEAITSANVATSSRQPFLATKLTERFDNKTEKIQEKLFLSGEHLGAEECSGVKNERMGDLISSLGQEMVLLTNELSSTKHNSVALTVKLELLKKLAERQTSLHQCQVSFLEQQLFQTKSLLMDAQRERERYSQQAEELQSHFGQLKRCSEQQQCELQEEVKVLRGRLEAAMEQLHRGTEEKTCLQAKLEQKTKGWKISKELLEEKNKEVQLRQQEAQQAELDQRKSDLVAAEHERRQLQASAAEQQQCVQEETLEKQQLSTQLELQRMQLLNITKEHKQLQQLHSCMNTEHEGVVLKLQSRLRNAQDELDQVRGTLWNLEEADGHGLQAAMHMQEKITARREQIDSLQGKIKHLEETVEKLHQEKRYQSLEHKRQLQELTVVREEKRQLGDELEALRSKDKQLRERIGQLEAILHKMSESFADCQDFIQLQEQEFYRLKLQHALDLKPKRQQESSAQELRSLVKELREVLSENHRPHTDNNGAGSHRRRSAPERVHRTTCSTDKAEEVKAGFRFRRKTCGSELYFLKTADLKGKMINKSFSESPAILSPATAQLLSPGRRSPVHSLLTSDPKRQ